MSIIFVALTHTNYMHTGYIGFTKITDYLWEIDNNSYIESISFNTINKYNQNTVFIDSLGNNHLLWHLDILDGTIDNFYNYTETGKDVNIVLVDAVIDHHHDFGKRINNLRTNVPNTPNNSENIRTIHHGTECSGVAVSNTYGVAKEANLWYYGIGSKDIAFSRGLFKDIMNSISQNIECTPEKKCILLLPMGSYHDDTTYLNDIISTNSFIIVAPIGNDNMIVNSDNMYCPACNPNVISVGGYMLDGNNQTLLIKSPGSNYALNDYQYIDLYAPGTNIITTGHSNSIVTNNGTSLSASITAGWISKQLELNTGLNVSDIRKIINGFPQRLNGIPVL